MSFIDQMAEARIQTAAESGAFDNLSGAGRPLPADDARLVPPELRAGYRLLKNAGFVPPEVAQAREVRALHQLLAAADSSGPNAERLTRRLRLLETTLAASRRGRGLLSGTGYDARLQQRLARKK